MFFPFRRRGLNPQASEYFPRFHQTQLPPLLLPSLPSTTTFISLPPPPWSYTLPYLNNTLLLPPPPPPHPPPPPPSDLISVFLPPPPAANQETELVPVSVNRPNNVRVSRGARVSTSSNRSDFEERGKRLSEGGQYSNLSEEKNKGKGNNNNQWRINLKKHGMRYLREDEYNTTVMIKNIPFEFTRQMLIDFMDKHCMLENEKSDEHGWKIPSAYDFLYLPIDFKSRKNKGYGFVNFTHPLSVWKFFNAYNSTKWDSTTSPKIIRIICARIQGKKALVQHFKMTYFDCDCEEFFPIYFTPARDGSGKRVKATTVGKHRK